MLTNELHIRKYTHIDRRQRNYKYNFINVVFVFAA